MIAIFLIVLLLLLPEGRNEQAGGIVGEDSPGIDSMPEIPLEAMGK